jgi:NAD(P)-dependent dehydrogenase (short-subunit alcohol dehydrogenase family)
MLREGALKGKTILITGGGSGLGKSMTRYFSELGANTIITGRREEVLKEAAAEMEKETGNPVLAVPGDVRKHESVVEVMTKGIERFGAIHGLVNNAAGNFISPTERLSHRAFNIIIDIVLKGSMNYTLEMGKYWIENKIRGVVLNINVTWSWTGNPYTVPSATAKAGVLAMTRSLAVEWGAKYGIRLNAIAPGPFPTKGAWDRLFPPSLQEKIEDPTTKNPMGRTGRHQELANLAAYLMSDYSAFVNGEVITIDGGDWLTGNAQFTPLNKLSEEDWDTISAEMRGK